MEVDFIEFLKILRENFYAELNMKTGWGKEELKQAFERSISNSTATIAQKLMSKQ